MKVLVVLVAACMASCQAAYAGPHATPVVNPNGFLVDTPEVAAAKAAHFSEVAKAGSPAGYNPGPYNGAPSWNAAPAAPSWNAAPATPSWNAAPANPSWNAAPANPSWNAAPSWNSAPATPSWNAAPSWNAPSAAPSGFLADTPEIAAAKAAHYAELAKVQSQGSSENYDDGSYRPEYDNPSYSAAPAQRSYSAPNSWSAPAPSQSWSAPSHSGQYAGPQATPVVTPQGFLADTPEVAAAKAAHFTEVARAGSHGRYRRSAVLVPVASPHLVHATPVLTYAAPAAPVLVHPHPHSHAYAYSVRTW